MRQSTHLIVGIVGIFVLVVGACTVANDRAVKAIDLTNGETRTFSSADDVPGGWAVCEDDACETIPETVPCQNLSQDVCSLNPACRLRTLSCSQVTCGGIGGGTPTPPPAGGGEGIDSAEPGAGGGSEPGSEPTDFAAPVPPPGETCDPEPPQCDSACVPKDELFCEEVKEKSECLQRADCNWGQVMCPAIACADGSDCDVECPYSCYADAPPSCGQLDEISCSQRDDCQWSPGACPLCAYEDGTACECKPFCQERSEPDCPDVPSPPDSYCTDGELSFKYDERGCVVSYVCQPINCMLAAPMRDCGTGVAVPVYDKNGCIVDYSCDNTVVVNNDCQELETAYSQALQQAKACNAASAAPTSCNKQVADSLACGCFTYVDASNTSAINELQTLSAKWEQLECGTEIACPAVPCWVPDGATCSPTVGTSGSCQNN